MLLSAGRVLTPSRQFVPGWVSVEGDTIADVGPGPPPATPDWSLHDATVVPVYVDAHARGGGGAAFGSDAEAAAAVARAHLAHGTTTMMASLVTDALEPLVRAVTELAVLVEDGLLAGIHLEGSTTPGDLISPIAVSLGSPPQLYPASASHAQHTCAVAGGTLYCWGANASGQCGQSPSTTTSSPTMVTGL